jgi:CRISPR-associated protein Csd1
LFALLENVQRAALGRNINATIRDEFFGSASASPARVFPLLLRGAQDHLGSVRKKESKGLSIWFDQRIADVMSGLPASNPFPASLRLEDQGRFAVGYYHQRWAAKAEGREADGLQRSQTIQTPQRLRIDRCPRSATAMISSIFSTSQMEIQMEIPMPVICRGSIPRQIRGS